MRRRGYGSAILSAAEELVARGGSTSLGLNVVGDNEAAVALYRRNGYDVSSMALRKSVQRAPDINGCRQQARTAPADVGPRRTDPRVAGPFAGGREAR
ncbi:GNAT family N-acetyltransferase [Streptomyces sp. NPDC046805]|uniref:GNAT family N-acetyltransferase n=1 Tax=Streptomyces sp. NPDC046805 TaxID=3155134 RepID=UPI0033EFCA71